MAVALRQLWSKHKSWSVVQLSRSIMTTPSKCEKALENLEKNPYYEKYAARIASLQQSSPDEFLARVEAQERARRDQRGSKSPAGLAAPGPVDTRQYSSVLNPKEKLEDKSSPTGKKLEDIFKLELVKDKDVSEIQAIWEQYHQQKEVISAAIPTAVYEGVWERMRQYPTFLFPLPRSQGYEFILCQVASHSLHFTPLLAYQVHKENAPECLTMIHYTELRERGLVLMRGEYDKNVLNGKEAQCLANQFQLYYNGKDEEKLILLESFNAKPDAFKHTDLITHLENISLS